MLLAETGKLSDGGGGVVVRACADGGVGALQASGAGGGGGNGAHLSLADVAAEPVRGRAA